LNRDRLSHLFIFRGAESLMSGMYSLSMSGVRHPVKWGRSCIVGCFLRTAGCLTKSLPAVHALNPSSEAAITGVALHIVADLEFCYLCVATCEPGPAQSNLPESAANGAFEPMSWREVSGKTGLMVLGSDMGY
jgi:hypothetical protein